jgi:DNA-directed RNA polymerase beta' subunit
MNISQPVGSHIAGVSFGFLASKDIRALSAKRITGATTFDTLLNPVPGGLYTPELGQFGDNNCATCGLKTPQCPGHCGHIELPVPCYHPTFMDQVLRLLRASCIYCGKLKLSRVHVNRFACKLRLVQYGLIKEIADLDDLTAQMGSKGKTTITAGSSDEDDDDVPGDAKELIETRDRFVKKAIKKARQEGRLTTHKTEALTNARRVIIQEFMGTITKGVKCSNCQGINHGYRKDRFVKIFRKPLKKEHRNKMIQSGLKAKDPVVAMYKKQKAEKEQGRKRKRDSDEGIADMERSSEEEEEEEESEGEVEIAGGDMMDTGAVESTGTKTMSEEAEVYMNQSRVYAQLEQLFENEQEIMGLIYGAEAKKGTSAGISAEMFFMKDILVPPNRFRPEAKTGNDEIAEAQENTLYKNILNICDVLTQIQRELSGSKERDERYRARTYADFENTWAQLQDAVNSLVDRDRNPLQGAAGKRNADGIKQKLEKKEGMFRKYMMGKRVNFAARTVISPDPNIETNEIGVPPVFAVKLTYPEPVTVWNVEELQEAVRNGPHVWPGAIAIENENGQVINLERKNAEERTALANQLLAPSSSTRGTRPKKVHRHLNNGDVVIMNRQPTLHKPSMMCHRARVLPGEKTLRMHYANCNTYNADFDGDEMNMHFPQNEIARAEALSIADTDHQYLSGTAGNPLRGLIQDHITMGVWLSNRDTFFNREDYMQLLYAALRPENGHCATGRIETVPPAIMKPRPLWTGKQVVTSVLKNITPADHPGLTMSGVSTTPKKLWSENSEEGVVIFKDGELMQGVLDKKQLGPSSGGVVNSVYEAYGHTVAGRLLSVMGRLLTKLLHMRAHSCGVEDLIFTRHGEDMRRDALSGAATVGLEVAAKYVSLENENPTSDSRELKRRLEDVIRDDEKQQGLDQLTNSRTRELSSKVTQACLPNALIKAFPKNQMQLMTSSGAKGSGVNANQISCNLGQQVLEGRRVPVMVSGKTLPCFKPFESSVRAGGYIVDRFLTGVRPQEFYFHAMAGREGLIDTAVKTSRSGYLQRCVIKGMEGLRVEHDTSVRDADGSVIQFLYGEDGLDVCKAKYLDNFKFAADNYMSLFQGMNMADDFDKIVSTDAQEHTKAAEKKYRKTGDLAASDPATSVYSPGVYAGAMSEKMFAAQRDYIDSNPDKLIKDKKKNIEGVVSKKTFQSINDIRYLRSVVEPGEAVGVVAGQSIGEPSTQMTLNTFHLAGHAAKNVTLGIPRLRELVMTAAANIATPTMTLKLNEEITVEEARKFAKGISKLSMAEVLDTVSVTESTGPGTAYDEAKTYHIKLDFFPKEEYMREYAITSEDVAATLEHRFLPRLQAMTRKELKKRGDERKLKASAKSDAVPEIGKSAGTVEQESGRGEAEREGGDDDSDAEGDDDATRDKSKNNRQQAGYEAHEDEEENILAARAQERDATPEADDSSEDETYGGSPRSSPGAESGKSSKSLAKDRENRIRGGKNTNDVVSFSFDDKTGASCSFTMEYDANTAKVLMLHLVEVCARQALVQSVPGLATCAVDEETSAKTGIAHVLTAGVNLQAMWDYQHVIHPHYIYTNSIGHILTHYGVEAARGGIVRELQGVFGGHGISVDPRHLTLIADYMTRDGAYQAFNRMGYRGNTSPFMKMSFETTLAFLRDAVQEGDVDDLTNPSARIVAGRVGRMGTGGFDVLMPLNESEDADGDGDGDVEMEG